MARSALGERRDRWKPLSSNVARLLEFEFVDEVIDGSEPSEPERGEADDNYVIRRGFISLFVRRGDSNFHVAFDSCVHVAV